MVNSNYFILYRNTTGCLRENVRDLLKMAEKFPVLYLFGVFFLSI